MYGPPLGVAAYRSHVSVDAEKCLGCGLCVKTCPAGALSLGNGLDGKSAAVVDEMSCGGCYKCVRRCPVRALSMQFTSLIGS